MALRAGTLARWYWSLGRECFPLMEHEQLGLTLHPFDLATNKILAMVGRLEVRDWVDVINADRRLQPLGYLLWAACGKDPGHVVRRGGPLGRSGPETALDTVPRVCQSI